MAEFYKKQIDGGGINAPEITTCISFPDSSGEALVGVLIFPPVVN